MTRNTNSAGFSLKDHLFNEKKVRYLAGLITRAYPPFKEEAFVTQVMSRLLQLELKERIRWIAEVLHDFLPLDYVEACTVIVTALPPPLDPTLSDNDFGDFIFAPLGEFVVQYGTAATVKTSLSTLREITMRFSMEDAIRYFINTYPSLTLKALQNWTKDRHYHVRRLVSEGLRPRLPWSARLNVPHTVGVPYLDILYSDTTRFVTRSVANHLNDIAKVDPALVIETLARYITEGKQSPLELAWMIKHALRTLIKAGDPSALALLGYSKTPHVTIKYAHVSPTELIAGEAFNISIDLLSSQNESVLVDYRIGFVKRNGTLAFKTYKLTTLTLTSDIPIRITKNHRLRNDATTYTLYEGVHEVAILINGAKFSIGSFYLKL